MMWRPIADDIITFPSCSTLHLSRLFLYAPAGLMTRLKVRVPLSPRQREHDIRPVYQSLIIQGDSDSEFPCKGSGIDGSAPSPFFWYQRLCGGEVSQDIASSGLVS